MSVRVRLLLPQRSQPLPLGRTFVVSRMRDGSLVASGAQEGDLDRLAASLVAAEAERQREAIGAEERIEAEVAALVEELDALHRQRRGAVRVRLRVGAASWR